MPVLSLNCNQTISLAGIERITTVYVTPVEMCVGFALQLLNLRVLHGRKIKGLAYTIYLKALSITYLITIAFLIPNLVRKTGHTDSTNWFTVVFHTHLETFLINLFLFAGNAIIVALGVEPLKAILWPLASLKSSTRRSLFVVAGIYAATAFLLLPTIAARQIVEITAESGGRTNATPRYCIRLSDILWVDSWKQVASFAFEAALIMLLLVVYIFLLLKYRSIVRSHQRSVTRNVQSSAPTLRSGHQKATAMSLGSITAFLLCNLPSACLEGYTLLLPHYPALTLDPLRLQLFRCVSNIMLLSNFTLTFFLQCAFSFQYRLQVLQVLGCSFEDPTARYADMASTTSTTKTGRRRSSAANSDRVAINNSRLYEPRFSKGTRNSIV